MPAGTPRDRFVAADPSVVVGDALGFAMAAFAHRGALRRVLARLKYGGAGRLAAPLAQAAAPLLAPALAWAPQSTLVPVPVHPERLRRRGYNQARLIAEQLGCALRLPVADVLVRARPTTQQHRLNRAQRLRNLSDAFVLAPKAAVPHHPVLVDDILTTSATLEACAMTLRRGGARRVLGVAIAREI